MIFQMTTSIIKGMMTSMHAPCTIILSVRCVSFVMLNIFLTGSVNEWYSSEKNVARDVSIAIGSAILLIPILQYLSSINELFRRC